MIEHGRELAELISLRNEEPTQVAGGSAGGDGFTLFRFADGTEVIETNAGLVTEDCEDFATLKHCCID
jgi:hypothetical protein